MAGRIWKFGKTGVQNKSNCHCKASRTFDIHSRIHNKKTEQRQKNFPPLTHHVKKLTKGCYKYAKKLADKMNYRDGTK